MYKSFLYSPKRKEYKRGKKVKGVKCLFCAIAKGDKRVPALVLHRDKTLFVLMNIFPYNRGHIQIVPTRHVGDYEDLTDEEIEAIFKYVKKAIKIMNKELKPSGYNFGFNQGSVAGESIDHFHFHIVPRYEKESGFMEVVLGTKVMSESVKDVFKRLKKYDW